MSNQEWNGEGLPPVGAVCVRHYKSGCRVDEKVEIIGYYNNQVAYAIDGFIIPQNLSDVEFRPIPPEPSKSNKREMFAKKLSEDTGFAIHEDDAGEVYDAGYRKVHELTDEKIDKYRDIGFRIGAKWARDFIMGEEE